MLEFFRQYLPFYKNFKKEFLFILLGILLIAVASASTAYIIKPLLDEIFINKDKNLLYTIPIFVFFIYFAKGLGKYLQSYYTSYIGLKIIKEIREKLFSHILNLDMDYFNKNHSGKLVSRILNDINRIQQAISVYLTAFIRELCIIIALLFVIFYHSYELAFFSLLALPLAIYPLSKLSKRMRKLSYKSQQNQSDMTVRLNESFNNVKIIKINSTEEIEDNKFKKFNNKFFDSNIKAVKTNELISPLMELLGAIAFIVVILIGGSKVISGELTAGTFTSFIAALFMLYTPIKKITKLYNKMQDAIIANKRVHEIFHINKQIKSGNLSFPNRIEKISFKNICLNYDDTQILNNVNFEVVKNDILVIMGNNGSGKTSLINLIVRLYDTKAGTLKINNTNIKDIKTQELRKNISIVNQKNYLFNDTIAANISYGFDFNEQKVLEVLESATALDFVNKLKDGIYTKIEEDASNLSGGEQQKIAIARALYKNPKIIVFDEATSSLDKKSSNSIENIIKNISKDKITFVISHKLSTLKYATKTIILNNGKIAMVKDNKINKEEFDKYKKEYNLILDETA